MSGPGKDAAKRGGAPAVRYVARTRDDAQDRELAIRLNGQASAPDADPDHLKSLRPAIIDVCWWMAAALAVAAATLGWLT